MRFERPHLLALTTSMLIGLVALGLLIYIKMYHVTAMSSGSLLLYTFLIVLVAFVVINFSVERFIYNKVKIIYKNIHDLKVGSEVDEEEAVRRSTLDTVTREVSEWAEKRQAEIRQLQERENFRREFVGNVSHELKTPIFNIQGYLLTLLDGALDDPDINRKFLKRANKSVDRMIHLIEDLEVISNLEANRVQLSMSKFDIVELVKEVFELLENKAKSRKVDLRLKKDYEKPVWVHADRAKIEQVLVNLVSNAIKYGRKKGKVEILFHDMHDRILTEVSDNGVGIPQEDIPRVFERFYRVDKSRSREAGGTGLGLAIVKHILEAHKQGINVRSSEEAGSTFSFTLKKGK